MAIYKRAGARGYDVSEVFEAPQEAAQEVLCTYADPDEPIEARSNTFTIVMNRDICKSVEIANLMGVHLARKFPEQKILLVNTYAGTELMQKTLTRALAQGETKLPPEFARHLDAKDQDLIGDSDTPSPFPLNLRVLDAASGSLRAIQINEELRVFGAEEGMAVVILNSFEFAVFEDRNRKSFALDLVALREARSLTFVVFSHEMRADIWAHTPGHGGIGVISAFAGSVWRLMTQFDRARYNAFYLRIGRLTTPKRTTKAELVEKKEKNE